MLEQLESKNEKKLVKKFSKNGGIEIMENKELKENNIDNKYGIEYTKVGDYYMPNLVLEKEEKIILNKYGRLRLKFLKENKKAEYTIMFMNGILNNHLKEIQETAEEKVNLIVEQLKKENKLTEEMKNTNQLYWVGMMNNFKNEADNITTELNVYTNLMSISVASIGFVLPQIRHLTMKGDFVPYNPYLKIRIIKSKMKRLFIKNELKFLKKDVEKYEK